MVFNGSGTQTIVTVLSGTNDLSGGTLGIFLVLLPALIIIGFNAREPTREMFAGAAFASMIVAILGRTLGVVQDVMLGGAIAVFIGTLVLLIMKN